MASPEPKKQCFLCLGHKCKEVSKPLFFLMITKYLGIKIHPKEDLKFCIECISAIESFHSFYERIKMIHQGNSDWNDRWPELAKIELADDDLPIVDVPVNEDTVELSDDDLISIDLSATIPDFSTLETTPQKKKKKTEFKGRPSETVPRVRLAELMKYYENVACPVCSDKVNCATLNDLNVHFKEKHAGQKSYIVCCDKVIELEDVRRLRVHLKFHRFPETCRCDVCGKTFASPLVLQNHKQLHLPESERKTTCEICGKTFGRKHDLKQHKMYVHTKRLVVCQICGKELKPSSIREHVKQVHEGIKRIHVCAVCGKTYRCYTNFHHHMKSVHTDNFIHTPKKKRCTDCGKWIGAAYMKKHMVRHSGRSAYECPKCDKVFKLPGDLKIHMVKHTDERPFSCEICGAAFKTKQTFKTHMGQHTGVNPVKCIYCGKMISNSSNYLVHRRRMHLQEYLAEADDPDDPAQEASGVVDSL